MSDRERSRSRSPEPSRSHPDDAPRGGGRNGDSGGGGEDVKLYVGNLDYGT